MTLKMIRLELARTKECPEGDPRHGYELVAPLDRAGRLDAEAWRRSKPACRVRSFAPDQLAEHGHLIYTRHRSWAFSYMPGEDDDEPIYRLTDHRFREGDYVSVTEHDRETRPFRVVSVRPHHAGATQKRPF